MINEPRGTGNRQLPDEIMAYIIQVEYE